jgi:rhodanese-related sulfurtransferase
MAQTISPHDLKARIRSGGELAILDPREAGAFTEAHLFHARNLPLGSLEQRSPVLVPRLGVAVVVMDAGDGDAGLAGRGARVLGDLGYDDVAILDGGLESWRAAGFELFSGSGVPSKAFGEYVEFHDHTPRLTAAEVKALIDQDADMVILDSRPYDEYHRMNIPGGIDTPGAELVYRVGDLAPNKDTLVVVNCAGRTRSIIGAQSLINAGIPNRVAALENGTMGWHLAGLRLEHGQTRRAPDPGAESRAKALAAAKKVAKRFGVRRISRETLAEWRAGQDRRTLYLFDVRTPEEFVAGHMAGARSAPGGQLVQATEEYVGVLGARLVLIDDDGARATMTASWLLQMGWRDVVIFHDVREESVVRGIEAGAAQTLTAPDDDEGERTRDPEAIAQAMRDYLTWEVALVAQIERDGDAGFLRFV